MKAANKQRASLTIEKRRGAVLVLGVLVLTMVFAFVAFCVDIGYITLSKRQLQNLADAGALAGVQGLADGPDAARTAAETVAEANFVGHSTVDIQPDTDVELGHWDEDTDTFTVLTGSDEQYASAVRVTAKMTAERGNALDLIFAPVLGSARTDLQATAVSGFKPRDIMLVIDLSGSMNDDSELQAIPDLGPADVMTRLHAIWTTIAPSGVGKMNFTTQYIPPPTPGGDDDYNDRPDDDDDRRQRRIRWDFRIDRNDRDDRDDRRDDRDDRDDRNGRNDRNDRDDRDDRDDRRDDRTDPFDPNAVIKDELGIANTAYPYAEGSWDDYIAYVQNSTKLANLGLQHHYGGATLADYWLSQQGNSNKNVDLWQTVEQPITALKVAVQIFVNHLNQISSHDRVGLAAYTHPDFSGAILESPLGAEFSAIANIVWHRQAGHYDDYTNIGAGMKKARLELEENGRSEAEQIIVLMTDGIANRPDDKYRAKQFALEEAEFAAEAGIRIMTVSMGRSADKDLMQEIAELTEATHYHIPPDYNVQQYTAELQGHYQTIASDRRPKLED